MGRPLRTTPGEVLYHVLNRANGGLPIFQKPADYEAFERAIREAHSRYSTRILAYCLMPNHWHMVVYPRHDDELTRFMAWLTLTHTQRWHAHRQSAGSGHLYQGRFKSFPIQGNEHFLTVCRYVERNALRAGLVSRAEQWRWSSLWHWNHGIQDSISWLCEWPIDRTPDWIEWVNKPQTPIELESLRNCVQRGQPYGSADWVRSAVEKLRLNSTLNPRGRPRVQPKKVPDTFYSAAGKGS